LPRGRCDAIRGFTAITLTVLAVGIGANSAIFSLLDAVLFRPLPFANADRLVMLWERSPSVARHRISPLNFADWNDRNGTFDAMAAISGGSRTFVGRTGIAEQVPGQAVTARFFDLFGVRPTLGRTFMPSDVKPEADSVVLSERFWQTRLNASPTVVGRSILLDGKPFTVLGVVPASFQILARADLWTPFYIAHKPEGRDMHFLQAVGRLRRARPWNRPTPIWRSSRRTSRAFRRRPIKAGA
jgi:hypothetical protein